MMIIYVSGIQNIPGELIEAAKIDGASPSQILKSVTIPMVMPSITICTFLTLTNGFKLFDQNLALTNGAPSKMSEMLALNIYNTFYGRTGYEGVGQSKAVVFFIIVGLIAPVSYTHLDVYKRQVRFLCSSSTYEDIFSNRMDSWNASLSKWY